MTSVVGGGASVHLRCAPGLVCRVRSDGGCLVEGAHGSARVGQLALPVLSAFLTPQSFADGVAALQSQLSGTQSALELLSTIMSLRKVGALVEVDEDSAAFQVDAREGFGALPIHFAMLTDRVRTRAWLAGIAELVELGDVVLEIGCGTGVLAVAAAKAGARKVYGLEATPVADLAKRLASNNGVGDVVTITQGWSTAVELPERANVLVSEILDHDPFREGVLEASLDAARRLLEPGARMLPRRVTLYGVPVELSDAERARHGVTKETLARWKEDYDVSFTALEEALQGGTITGVPRRVAAGWRRLGAPVALADVVLDGKHPTRLDATHECELREEGVCHAIVTYFRAELTDNISVTTDPWSDEAATHWLSQVLMIHEPRPVAPGAKLRVRYRYPGFPSLELK